MAKKINFEHINAAALGNFESLLRQWLPDGKKSGAEYGSVNPTRNDGHAGSFSVNIYKGVWQDFATGEGGSDPISLFAYLFHGNDQGKAAKDLAEMLGVGSVEFKPVPVKKDKKLRSVYQPIVPPDDATEPHKAHPVRGFPEAVWAYRSDNGDVLGYVYRFKTSDGGKETLPLSWCHNPENGAAGWRWMSFGEPRWLYGLDRLHDKPKAPVLIVEGEKCADAAAGQLPDMACISWPGGSKAVAKVDWVPLAGRDVVIWPDCDAQKDKAGALLPEDKQPGMSAANKIVDTLLALDCKVWVVAIPKPGEKVSGWDIADAIDGGLGGDALAVYIRKKARPAHVVAPALDFSEKLTSSDVASAAKDAHWYQVLNKKRDGDVEPCRSNVAKILRTHPKWQGTVGYNEFSHQIERLRPNPCAESSGIWDGENDSTLEEWLVDNVSMMIKSMSTVVEGVSHAANGNKFHPVRDFLTQLAPWDGTERLNHYLSDITKTHNSHFMRLAGRFFLIAMVARIFRPGCKFDYMLVLEGKQGQGKSSFFRILADPWFSETPFDIGTNEGNMSIQGVWLQEMPELGMFSRSEDTAFKSFLATTKDKFRRPYDRRPVDAKRVCVFGGTTNLDTYLKDQTGNRRIWPVRCAEIDVAYLQEIREQLFAEAIVAFNAGERFYPTPDEERLYFEPEQASRLAFDGWEELIIEYLNDPNERLCNFYTATQILLQACKVEKSKIDEANKMTSRVGRIMSKIGWVRVRETAGPDRKWGYARPEDQRINKVDGL